MYSPNLTPRAHSMTSPTHLATRLAGLFACISLLGCGGPTPEPKAADAKPDLSKYAKFGPLEIGSDWQSYTKMNTTPVESGDHGERFVDTYVNEVGLAAYKDEEAEIPVGTVVVKTSLERDGDKPSDYPGPIFVMKKMEAGFDAPNGDWYYAIHWEKPTEKFMKKFGQMYWRSPSTKVKYCWRCHNDYDRQLGQVPEDQRVP